LPSSALRVIVLYTEAMMIAATLGGPKVIAAAADRIYTVNNIGKMKWSYHNEQC
jgi:hypothetical protein